MAAPLVSNASSVLSNPTMSLGGEALVTSSNPPAPILSGSHLISNSEPSQVSYSCDFEKTKVFLSLLPLMVSSNFLWLLLQLAALLEGVCFVTLCNTIKSKCLKFFLFLAC